MPTVNLYDSLNEVKEEWKSDALTLPVVLRGAPIGTRLGLPGMPTTFLLDAHGVVLDTIVVVDLDELESVPDRNVAK